MIRADARLSIRRIPLSDLHVYENQQRYPDRLTHYVRLLLEPSNVGTDPGIIHVKERANGFEILDGHHRYCALIMAGRPDALCLVIDESEPKNPTRRNVVGCRLPEDP